MVVVEKGYHANGRERTKSSPRFSDPRIAGTIVHGMMLTGPTAAGVSHARIQMFLSLPSINANGTRKFLKKLREMRGGRGKGEHFAVNL